MSKNQKKHKNRSKRNTQIDEATVKVGKTSTLSDVHKTLKEILDEIRWFRMCAMFESKGLDSLDADFDALFAEDNFDDVDKNAVESQKHNDLREAEQLEIPNIKEKPENKDSD